MGARWSNCASCAPRLKAAVSWRSGSLRWGCVPTRRQRDQNEAIETASLQYLRRQEAIAFFLDHAITLATQLFQLGPVEHRDLPTDVADDTELVQFAGGFGDPFPTYPQHVGDE